MLARRCFASIKYNGTDITEEISNDVLGFSFKDNMNKADGMELSLKDKTGKWMNDWFPEEGDFIEAEIHTINWNEDGDQERLVCGRFIIDTPSYSGPPDALSINGTSVPKNTGITDPQNRTYEKITLEALAARISALYGCELMYLVNEGILYQYLIQDNESDIGFLSRLCNEQQYFLKVSDNRIVIADDENLVGAPAATITRGSQGIISYSFSKSLVSRYKECVISYYSDKDRKVLKYVHPLDPDGEKVYTVSGEAESYEAAVNKCKAMAKIISRIKMTCQIELVGNIKLLAGVTVLLESFGKFNGEYLIEEAAHQIDGAYSTSINAFKVEGDADG